MVDPAPSVAVAYSESMEVFPNPERGWYRMGAASNASNGSTYTFLNMAAGGYTLAHKYFRLDDWKTTATLGSQLFTDINTNLADARSKGIKVMPQFTYNFGPEGADDATLSIILGHIEQLAETIQNNADVIAAMKCGFIGVWGEWHTSTNGNDTPANNLAVIEAVLDVLPTDRMIAVRYPWKITNAYGTNNLFDRTIAYTTTDRARIGSHDDCFLRNAHDGGTYQMFGAAYTLNPSWTTDQWKAYLADNTLHTLMTMETCGYEPGVSREDAIFTEGPMLHITSINRDFSPTTGMLDYWIAQGWHDEITRKQGYRFVLTDAQIPPTVRPGGNFRMRVRIKNVGWATLFNPRPIYLVIEAGATRHEAQLTAIDPRWWKGGESTVLQADMEIPASLAEGAYTLALWMPDPYASIKSNAAYAVRFANDDVWNAAKGYNVLGTIAVSDSAPGGTNAGATVLTVATVSSAGSGGGY